MRKGKWKNRKSGKVRSGIYNYIWHKDRFWIKIDGLREVETNNDKPEFENWKLI